MLKAHLSLIDVVEALRKACTYVKTSSLKACQAASPCIGDLLNMLRDGQSSELKKPNACGNEAGVVDGESLVVVIARRTTIALYSASVCHDKSESLHGEGNRY